MIRLDLYGIVCEGLDHVPSVYEICENDKRLLYLGTFKDEKGNLYQDAFANVLKPTSFFTIDRILRINDNKVLLDTTPHCFDEDSAILQNLYDKYSDEVYVGDVCDGRRKTGQVWNNTYKKCLSSKTLYTKAEDGTNILITPPEGVSFDTADYYIHRVVFKSPGQPDVDYAFMNGDRAFRMWMCLAYNAREDQEVLHNFGPEYEKFLDYDERIELEKYPKLVKAYPRSYNNTGFLNSR